MNMEMLEQMKTLIDDSHAKITALITANHTEITGKFDALSLSVNRRIDVIDGRCTEAIQQGIRNDDQLQRHIRATDVRINGILFKQGEDLPQLFKRIATELQYDVSNPCALPVLYRIVLRDKQPKESPTIIAKFITPHIKGSFFTRYLKHLKLNNQIFGAGYPDKRIIIGENLTQRNKLIFDEALKMRKEKLVHQVYTNNGAVMVKFDGASRAKMVSDASDLMAYRQQVNNGLDQSSY